MAAKHVDPRVEWLIDVVGSAVKVPGERRKKGDDDENTKLRQSLTTNATNSRLIREFFEDAGLRTLIVYIDQKDDILCSLEFPRLYQRKLCYFMRAKNEVITDENIAEALVWGDLSTNPIGQLEVVLDGVYRPLLENARNQSQWPDVVAEDVFHHFHKLSGHVYVAVGNLKGKTLLPLPSGALAGEVTKTLVHNLESAVIRWTHQIESVVRSDSESPIKDGLNPPPLFELGFWEAKAANLKSIYDQLSDEKIQKIGQILEAAKSSYYPAFQRIFDDVKQALEEAENNNLYLQTLRPYLESLHEADDMATLRGNFRPLMHTILLVWRHSKHYNVPSRLVVLLREICNDIITTTETIVDNTSIFKIDADVAVEKLSEAQEACEEWKSVFNEYKAKANSVESESEQWRFDSLTVFDRFDKFLERLRELLALTNTILEFSKLEKVEIGGTRGKILSAQLAHIFREFDQAKDVFQAIDQEYDVLNIEQTAFVKDHDTFLRTINDLERRIGAVITQAFDDCTNVIQAFKLLDSFQGLLGRETIRTDMGRKYISLLHAYGNDLSSVYEEFRIHSDDPPLHENLPPVAGRLKWIAGLRERIDVPMERLLKLDRDILESEDAQEVRLKFDALQARLDEYQQKEYEQWTTAITSQAHSKLKLNLLIRREEDMLSVNFDAALVALLREVKYLQAQDAKLEIPPAALTVYKQGEKFRQFTSELNLVCQMYNATLSSMLPVERPLIQPLLSETNALLAKGISQLTWNDGQIEVFIESVSKSVTVLHTRLENAKANVSYIQSLMAKWSTTPLVERKDAKKVLVFKEEMRKMQKLFSEMALEGREIHHKLDACRESLGGVIGSDDWIAYQNYVHEIVLDGLVATVKSSLEYLISAMDSTQVDKKSAIMHSTFSLRKEEEEEFIPLVEAKLELLDGVITFTPDLEEAEGLVEDMAALAEEFVRVGHVLGRLDNHEPLSAESLERIVLYHAPPLALEVEQSVAPPTSSAFGHFDQCQCGCRDLSCPHLPNHSPSCECGCRQRADYVEPEPEPVLEEQEEEEPLPPTYITLLSSNETVVLLKNVLLANVRDTVEQSRKVRDAFVEFKFLWTDSKEKYLKQFLRGAPIEAQPDERVDDEEEEDEVELHAPDLHDFDSKIEEYKRLFQEIQNLDNTWHFMWLRVDTRPIKNGIMSIIRQWSHMFTQHLYDGIVERLEETKEFIDDVTRGLSDPVNDYDSLVAAMGHLLKIRSKTDETDTMWISLKDSVALLKKHGITMPDDVLHLIESLPQEWSAAKKLSYQSKEALEPKQAAEAKKVREEREMFEHSVADFRESFVQGNIFLFSAKRSNLKSMLGGLNDKVHEFESNAQRLYKNEQLFDLTPHDHIEIRQCRTDLKHLKQLWEMIGSVESQLNDWMDTQWNEIDTVVMEEETKRFKKDIFKLNRSMRSWDAYIGLDKLVKNNLTALHSVSELKNPAMRDRHWRELMQATGKRFELTDNFKLKDLMDLRLHEYEDSVREIVDRAQKEAQMEKQLGELGKTWSTNKFEFGLHKQSDTPVLLPLDDLMESLETDQVTLQSMLSSRFVQYFYDDVLSWQKKLSAVDSVIGLWLEVQYEWDHLETIFILSEDIRKQLPNDSKRFDGIDKDWKELMNDIVSTPLVVEACARKGLLTTLDGLSKRLERCEKSLFKYLETKRLAFPRFYFVSSNDLLDILSKTQQPELVCSHLPKLFRRIQSLKFVSKTTAVGMTSIEGEYVAFSEPLECVGPVECWLNDLVVKMQITLKHELSEAYNTYEEKPREAWLMEHPAQIAQVGSQIRWAEEVDYAFVLLEEGNSNSLKDEWRKQDEQVVRLIKMVQGQLTPLERQKIMTILTVDVHSRDIVEGLKDAKAETSGCFQWQSQLRMGWDEEKQDCYADICDAHFNYSYEYQGNASRLVITPLTDRCYITLTQALRLHLGGAPAGPAGTGKTETTKDLGAALGVPVYVFNCSPEMDYKSLAQIFKGLAQSGAWGCFDEFNRINIEVLSVVATQVKSVLDAIRRKPTQTSRFQFQGEEISLNPSCGIFITMNPGYAGRTELPENIKALFRGVSMVVPDLAVICEIMLMAEGFVSARELGRKFTTLYALCKDLLSKQDQYDWGLRAIKSVLVVAGSLKRKQPSLAEEDVLLRALRDFNLPKIVPEDVAVFRGLISDLFPGKDPPRVDDAKLTQAIKDATVQRGLQGEDLFVLKCVQLYELLEVRHSVFIIGPSGSGKTQCWKTLAAAQTNFLKLPTIAEDLNPKAVSSRSLFGYVSPQSREWKDGLLSSVMRRLAAMNDQDPKWIVLDGDIDPDWIESLNTVMDDNKVLTLSSNERVPLHPWMRLVFEIGHLKHATPATVSRAGILYMSESDLGWQPFVLSWIDRREDHSEKNYLLMMFNKYMPSSLEHIASHLKPVVPISEISIVQTLCWLLEGLLTNKNAPPGSDKEVYEIYFVWAAVWSLGGALNQDPLNPSRTDFSNWWRKEWGSKGPKFPTTPDAETVFDYFVDPVSVKFVPWVVPEYEHVPDVPVQNIVVPTVETVRLNTVMNLLADNRHPILLVGTTGTSKTMLVKHKLATLDEEETALTINLNHYTTADVLQSIMEAPLEKKAGKTYGPRGKKKLVYFIDDLNMPQVDKYGTQSPITLLRQHLDYGHWYDRQKLTVKDVRDVQYMACLNPTAGSFTINPRLQRHFAPFAVNFPSEKNQMKIFGSILTNHLKPFSSAVVSIGSKLLNASIDLHKKVTSEFLPTAVKFHYQFNLRELERVFQGILRTAPATYSDALSLIKLWIHESERVYADRMVNQTDLKEYQTLVDEVLHKYFADFDKDALSTRPLFASFADGIGDGVYKQIKSFGDLHQTLEEALMQHNEVNASMNLVLFEDAMEHVCRISRIIENPRGSALLVGVGGSGKQSLTRLAAFINDSPVFQIQLTSSYGEAELREDLKELHMKTGINNNPRVFLITDTHIVNETFLVLINDLLASGTIHDLFTAEEKDSIIGSVRSAVKLDGSVPPTNENCWQFFINRVRANLHIVLSFSPVGDVLRQRARKFPAIVSSTSIDWFQPWPEEALLSVGDRFLTDVDLGTDPELKGSVSAFMAFSHSTVNELSIQYQETERRHNYTTPKSFLELIALYKSMLSEQAESVDTQIHRLVGGLDKIQASGDQVSRLQERLAREEVEVSEKTQQADELLERVSHDQEVVTQEEEVADQEARKAEVMAKEVAIKRSDCEEDLRRAEPALVAANEALDTLNKGNITEMSRFGSPPKDVVMVAQAVQIMLKGPTRDTSWPAARRMMSRVETFLQELLNYDKESISPEILKALEPFISSPNFNGAYIRTKSVAAAGMCEWVRNIVDYYHVFCEVEPKRIALNEAAATQQACEASLASARQRVSELRGRLQQLQDAFQAAREEKVRCERRAKDTAHTLDIADRLVCGLASEKVRWAASVEALSKRKTTLVGDVLLSSAFISYAGGFSRVYREQLVNEYWIPYLRDKHIPVSENVDPLDLLADDAAIATWNNEGLPTDRISIENAAILTNCKRWPLIIDPQLQGVGWLRQKEGDGLHVVRLQGKYLGTIERAVSLGEPVLLENLSETVDSVLDPLLGRALIKRGKCIKLGDEEIDYDPSFRLFLHTKMANPHYRPEIQAQCTVINFTVTERGLEEQLLAEVMSLMEPEMERKKTDLIRDQNSYKIKLKGLEDSLLASLSDAEGDFLGNLGLVENLESTKSTAEETGRQVADAKKMEAEINTTREVYRPVAARASLLYFLLNDLSKIHAMYQFSLKAFVEVFQNSIRRSSSEEVVVEPNEDLKHARVRQLVDSVTFAVFRYAMRGLFERHKLIFTTQLCLKVVLHQELVDPVEADHLVRAPTATGVPVNPIDWLPDKAWAAVHSLKVLPVFSSLPEDMEQAAKRWKKWCDLESPETEKLPMEYKHKSSFQKLLIVRALRPDRLTYAVQSFIAEQMGHKFITSVRYNINEAFEECSQAPRLTPIFFILSPGVDPLQDVEELGKKQPSPCTEENGRFLVVSLGQGQEVVAEAALDLAAKKGFWVMLQNLHLVEKWLPSLERRLEHYAESSHPQLRIFLSAEPHANPSTQNIPAGILQTCIKITNEPPRGMRANLERAWGTFSQDTLESCSKEGEFKHILFAMCYFHAVVLERRKFGPQGWNIPYSFTTGDLTICKDVLLNYLEVNSKVPWEDLRYIFGEIMYGGHISDNWDRRLCSSYLKRYVCDAIFEDEFEFAPGFPAPPPGDYQHYCGYINDTLPTESPHLFGLHPNAEINFLTEQASDLFSTIRSLQPRRTGGVGGVSVEECVREQVELFLTERIPEDFPMSDLYQRAQDDRSPYNSVCLQECARMNVLLSEMRRSLSELLLGLKGDLTMSAAMEALEQALFTDHVPDGWARLAYPSLKPLGAWMDDLTRRVDQLARWSDAMMVPPAVWLAGLFNAQSFLTAIKQTAARKQDWPLDRMTLVTEVTKKHSREDITQPHRDGAYVYGLYLEGARWDSGANTLADSHLKQLYPPLPILLVKAVPIDRADMRDTYECPVYITRRRGPTFVCPFHLRTKVAAEKWVMAGVALLLSSD